MKLYLSRNKTKIRDWLLKKNANPQNMYVGWKYYSVHDFHQVKVFSTVHMKVSRLIRVP